MNRESIMKLQRDLLAKVKETIASGDERFICLALESSAVVHFRAFSVSSPVAVYHGVRPIISWIYRLLCANERYAVRCLDNWLANKGLTGDDKVKETRLRWIDWMLVQLENNTAQELIKEMEEA